MYVHIDIWEVWSTLSVALMWPCQSWTKVTLQCSPKSLLTLEALLLRPFNASSTIYCVNVFMWSGLGFINIDNYFIHVFLPVMYLFDTDIFWTTHSLEVFCKSMLLKNVFKWSELYIRNISNSFIFSIWYVFWLILMYFVRPTPFEVFCKSKLLRTNLSIFFVIKNILTNFYIIVQMI